MNTEWGRVERREETGRERESCVRNKLNLTTFIASVNSIKHSLYCVIKLGKHESTRRFLPSNEIIWYSIVKASTLDSGCRPGKAVFICLRTFLDRVAATFVFVLFYITFWGILKSIFRCLHMLVFFLFDWRL